MYANRYARLRALMMAILALFFCAIAGSPLHVHSVTDQELVVGHHAAADSPMHVHHVPHPAEAVEHSTEPIGEPADHAPHQAGDHFVVESGSTPWMGAPQLISAESATTAVDVPTPLQPVGCISDPRPPPGSAPLQTRLCLWRI
ncbi:hypothetical protein ACQPXS_35595 [Streptomyces sp. CA-142005]|uniref:hypothetical protein n=1 Tax=Streptomyces sp. CA-142005 TaxID=3240052 RepID=UPI003D907F55